MRIGNGGYGWQAVGSPAILLDGEPVSVVDLVYADDEAGEVGLIDHTKSVDNGHGFRVFPPGSVRNGAPPFEVKRGKVEFRFNREKTDG